MADCIILVNCLYLQNMLFLFNFLHNSSCWQKCFSNCLILIFRLETLARFKRFVFSVWKFMFFSQVALFAVPFYFPVTHNV